MLEHVPFRVIRKWTVLAVVFVTVMCLLGASTPGLMVVAFGFAHLFLFRPPVAPRITDADIWRLIDG